MCAQCRLILLMSLVYKHNIRFHQDEEEVGASDLQTIIDQKSYIEELNRNLAVNITNLQVLERFIIDLSS